MIECGIAAGMIEVKMSIDDDGNFVRRYSGPHAQGLTQRSHTFDGIERGLFRRPFSANTSLNQYLFGARIDEYTIHIHPNTVLLVGWTQLRPKVAWDDSKHRASIETEFGVRNNFDAIIAYLHPLLPGLVRPQTPRSPNPTCAAWLES